MRTRILEIKNFLNGEEHRALLRFTLSNQNFFTPSIVMKHNAVGIDDKYRVSLVLYNLGEMHQIFDYRIRSYIPWILQQLEMPSLNLTDIEIQLTATGNGGFFSRHKDNGSMKNASRLITFVYYFYQEPKRFSNGEILFNPEIENASNIITISPQQNTVIVFESSIPHEVRMVTTLDEHFESCRFTVNGWLRVN